MRCHFCDVEMIELFPEGHDGDAVFKRGQLFPIFMAYVIEYKYRCPECQATATKPEIKYYYPKEMNKNVDLG